MSARAPLPLRWLQPPPTTTTTFLQGSADAASSGSHRVLSVYKPSGLPYFSASQVTAVADPRRLFAVQRSSSHSGAAAASAGLVSGVQPNPDDTSDSLSARLSDTLPLGATPYVTLPLVSSLLLQQRHQRRRTEPSALANSATVNAWTSHYKGVTLVSLSQGDALFVRNASRMGLVSQTFHVLVRLPDGVGANARAQAAKRASTTLHEREERRRRFLNPYVREMDESRQFEDECGSHVDSDSLGVRITSVQDGSLPRGLRHEALLDGSLVDWRTGRLRFRGSLSGFLRANTPLPADAQRAAATKRRLTELFIPVCGKRGAEAFSARQEPPLLQHPWIPPEQLLTVSVEHNARGKPSASRKGGGSGDADGGKRTTVRYNLLAIGSQPDNDVALYEVKGTHVAPEEVAALFAAEGFYPVNDYANDRELAAVVAKAAAELRANAPQSTLANLPMALRHRLLTSASPEELVALPIMRQPLWAADRVALSQLHSEVSQYSDMNVGMLANGGAEEFLVKLRQSLELSHQKASPQQQSHFARFHKRTDLMGQLLYTSLSRSQCLTDADFALLLRLALGSGVECVGVAFPDPANVSTALAMQHAMARFEEGQLGESHKEELMQSMRYLSTGTSPLQSSTMSSAAYGMVNVPRGWLPPGVSGTGFERAEGVVEDVAFSYALALTSPAASDTLSEASPAGQQEATEARAARTVMSLADVPETYSSFYETWRDTRTTSRGAVDGEAPHVITRSLLPSRAEIRAAVAGSANTRETPKGSRRRAHETAANLEAFDNTADEGDLCDSAEGFCEKDRNDNCAIPLTPIAVRVEELGLYHCASCGNEGHTWQCCPLTNVNDPTALPAFKECEGALQKTLLSSSPTTKDDATSSVAKIAADQEELLTNASDVDSALEAQDERRVVAASLSRFGNFGDNDALVAVPNVAPTAELNVHAMRLEAAKPAMQRRAVRCAYCHGRHHIAQCPKLQGPSSHTDASELLGAVGSASASAVQPGGAVVIDEERVRREPENLFCIRCGTKGHLYTACPMVPDNLHPATHCAICLQSFQRMHHRPIECPRRVSLPSAADYFANGIPKSYVIAEELLLSRNRFGSGSAERRRQNALQKRKRGSMLIADTFIERHQ